MTIVLYFSKKFKIKYDYNDSLIYPHILHIGFVRISW